MDTAKNVIDTTAVKFSELHQANGFIDLATILPFHDHYRIWDTTVIHPYHYDLRNMQDTVMLVLAEHGECGFFPPVLATVGRAADVTSGFGPRVSPRYRYVKRGKRGRVRRFTGYASRYHYGIDLKLHTGDSVYAAFDGLVRISQYNSGYGHCVIIRHYNGLETVYGHLSERMVSPGDVVKAGDIIGLGGSTGHSTGPHLHFETRFKGEPIDPSKIINFTSDTAAKFYTLKTDTLLVTNEMFNYKAKAKTVNYTKGAASSRSNRVSHTSYYTIRRGDSLSRIAINHNTTINRLCQLNRISRETKLQLGQKLKVR